MVMQMDISLDYYRIFYYTARCGSITQAAQQLYSNQPNVTRVIKLLESELSCQLFSRTNRGVRLTPEGEVLYAHVEPAMAHLEAAQRELSMERAMQRGSLSIGVSEVALRCLLLPVLKQFRSRYPGIQIRVSNHSTPQAIAALQEGLVDFALVTTPLELGKEMQMQRLKTIREVPVCGPGMDCPDVLTPEDLCRYPLISLGRDTMSYPFYESWFRKLRLPFRPDVEAATADQILPMVANDLGIGFVPEAFLKEAQDVRLLSLSVPNPKRDICLVRKTAQPLRIAAKELGTMLCSDISL